MVLPTQIPIPPFPLSTNKQTKAFQTIDLFVERNNVIARSKRTSGNLRKYVLEDNFPAITLDQLVKLYENRGFLVILGYNSAQEADARVEVVESVDDVRRVTINRDSTNTKVLSWTEAYGHIVIVNWGSFFTPLENDRMIDWMKSLDSSVSKLPQL